jgi:SAM-dependent methyltransferase
MEQFVRWLNFNLQYLGRPRWDTGVTPPEVVAFIRDTQAGRALDLGCGTGTNLAYLAQAGWQVTGVEYVPRAARAARRRLKAARLKGEVIVGDVTRLPESLGSFDYILDMGCFHGIDAQGRKRYQRGLAQRLKPGGSFMIYAHLLPGPDAKIGITQADIDGFCQYFSLVWRVDSLDSRGRRAVWMRFTR